MKYTSTTGESYYLHGKGGVLFFSKKKNAKNIKLPSKYTIKESDSGLPLLKRKG